MVVIEVSRIGRKRAMAAWRAACCTGTPFVRSSRMNTTSRMESLTTTPNSEAMPTMLGSVRSRPSAMWPKITPISAVGITDITATGAR